MGPRLLTPAWRNRATAEQKRLGWAMVVRIEKVLCTVLHETHERQVEGTMGSPSLRDQSLLEVPPGLCQGVITGCSRPGRYF